MKDITRDQRSTRNTRPLFGGAAISILSVLLLCDISESVVHADDNHGGYPATLCQPWYYEPGSPHYGENGRVANESTTSRMTLVCPLITGSPSATADNTVTAVVRDLHATQAVECAHYRQLMTSDSRSFINMGATTGSSSSFKTLGASMTALSAQYNYYVVCSFPPRTSSGSSAMAGVIYDD